MSNNKKIDQNALEALVNERKDIVDRLLTAEAEVEQAIDQDKHLAALRLVKAQASEEYFAAVIAFVERAFPASVYDKLCDRLDEIDAQLTPEYDHAESESPNNLDIFKKLN